MPAVRVLHFSDIHVQIDYRSVPWRALGWRRAIAQIEMRLLRRADKFTDAARTVGRIVAAADRLGVEHAVCSGDLTGLGLPAEFEAARAALGPLATPERLTVIPGNHDRYTREHQGAFECHFGDLCHSDLPEHCRQGPYPFVRLVGAEAAVVAFSTARLAPFPGLVYGRVGEAQFDGLRAILADPRLSGRAVLAVVHHAPRDADGLPDLVTHRLLDADRLLAALPGPRHAVLFGHVHRRFWHQATSERPHLFGAGSSTQTGDTGYWLIDVRGGEVSGGVAVSLEEPAPALSA